MHLYIIEIRLDFLKQSNERMIMNDVSLSCECSDWDGEGWAYWKSSDFIEFKRNRRKRCCSCKEMIEIGSLCVEFERFRLPISEVEERIVGGEDVGVPLASYLMCEKCGEIFMNLDYLGYCIDITENMNDYLERYHEFTGFKKRV